MGVNLTIYCLQNITDYAEFERLCHDLMSLVGYISIEPLGRFKDKGRDAIHISNSNGSTIFAYSVREDWRAKLAEDATKIHKHGHPCNNLVFATNADFTAGERDEAVSFIRDSYGWELEIYGLERLRVMLDAQFPQLKASHPQIFPTQFLAGNVSLPETEQRDHLFISYTPTDTILAEWLTRKLTAEGYLVWCERFKLLGGESYPDDVDRMIQTRACRVIALYSQASLKNPDVVRQCALALGISRSQIQNFLIPLHTEQIPAEQLDQATRALIFVPFETNWAQGLQLLLKKLDELSCPKPLPNGQRIAG